MLIGLCSYKNVLAIWGHSRWKLTFTEIVSLRAFSFVFTAILNFQAGCRCTLVPRLLFPVPRSPFLVLVTSLPLLLDGIFGMIFPFQSALGILKNFLSVPYSIIIYPNTNKCWLTWLLILLIFNLIEFNLYIAFIPGGGRRLGWFLCQNHPTKSDVTSGWKLSWTLVSLETKDGGSTRNIFFYILNWQLPKLYTMTV